MPFTNWCTSFDVKQKLKLANAVDNQQFIIIFAF